MKHFKFLAIAASALLVAAALSFSACGDDEPDPIEFKVVPTSLEFDAAGGTKEIAVTGDWDATPTTEAAWLTLSATATKVTVTAEANTGEARTSTIKIGTSTVTVTQKKEGSDVVKKLSANPTSLTFVAESAPAQDVTVTAENVGTWSANSTDNWITVTEKDGAFTVAVSDNAGTAERTGTISLTATDYTGVVTITVKQAFVVDPGYYPDLAGSYNVTSTKLGLHSYDFPTNFSTDIVNMPATPINTGEGTIYWNLYEVYPWLISDYDIFLHYTTEGKLIVEDQLYLFQDESKGLYIYAIGVTINSSNVITNMLTVDVTIESNGNLTFANTAETENGTEALYLLFGSFKANGEWGGSIYSDASTDIVFTKTTKAGGSSTYTATYKSIAKEDLSIAPGVSLNRSGKNISVR